MKKLSPQLQLFVREYCVDFQAARSARACGITKQSSSQRASEWLALPEIQDAIQKTINGQLERADWTADDIRREYQRMLEADRRGMYDENGTALLPNELNADLAACLEGFKMGRNGPEYKFTGRKSLLRDLGEMHAMFKQVIETNGTLDVALSDDERETIHKQLDSGY